MRSRSLFGVDFILLGATLALVTIGLLFIYSSNVTSTGVVYSHEYIKQAIWIVSGLIFLFFIAFFDYSLLNEWAPYIYAFFIIILAYTLIFGRVVNGAKSWLGFSGGIGIQPSEFTKIATILLLAKYLGENGFANPGTQTIYFCIYSYHVSCGIYHSSTRYGNLSGIFPDIFFHGIHSWSKVTTYIVSSLNGQSDDFLYDFTCLGTAHCRKRNCDY